LTEFFAMHGYGGYVWSAYSVFFIVLLVDAVAPVLRRRQVLAELRGRLKREAARSSNGAAKTETNA
jgi:heme exporter protein D